MNNEKLKLCTLSGNDEIGRNCSFVEYNNQIVIVDCGFSFPGQELYGIDYLIPNYDYLVRNKKKVKAILITHGHLDHTGALSYILPKLDFPPVYAGRFACALIKERLSEFDLDKKAKLIDVHRNTDIQIGDFKATFIGVTHSIPNSFSIFVQSQAGNIFFSGDYKIDEEPANEHPTDFTKLQSIQGKVDLALMESTNAMEEGKSKSSMALEKSLEEIVNSWNGRIIIASFSSLVSRIYSILRIAQKSKRKVAVFGRSLQTSLRIAQELGYINIPENLLVDPNQISKISPRELLVLTTGSQGEQFSALNLISQDKHKTVKVKKGDLIILSSSEIPSNIVQIQHMTDRLISSGAEIIKDDNMFVHETGHGLKIDMKIMHDLVKAKNVMPIHGWLTLRYMNKKNMLEWGMKEQNILLTKDGQMWSFDKSTGVWQRDKQIDAKPILIDGLGVGDVGDVVIRDRQQLADYGFFTAVINFNDSRTKIIGKIKYFSRGFVYMKKSNALLNEISNVILDTHRHFMNNKGFSNKNIKGQDKDSELRSAIENSVSRYVYKKTEREPLIQIIIF